MPNQITVHLNSYYPSDIHGQSSLPNTKKVYTQIHRLCGKTIDNLRTCCSNQQYLRSSFQQNWINYTQQILPNISSMSWLGFKSALGNMVKQAKFYLGVSLFLICSHSFKNYLSNIYYTTDMISRSVPPPSRSLQISSDASNFQTLVCLLPSFSTNEKLQLFFLPSL